MPDQSLQNLISLRLSPRQAVASKMFYVDTQGMNNTQIGCSVRIKPEIQRGITVLKITPGGNDYYFPYVQGVGEVSVGATNNIPEGTIAVTGGMNGCALEATVKNNQFVFYHDQNGRCMNGVRNAGRTVCRITEASYWPQNIQMMQHQYPIIQFISVYRNSFWHVVCFGLFTDGRHSVNGGFEPLGGRYRGYFNDNIKLMQR